MVERIPIGNDEQWHALRDANVGASQVGAIPGLHPYLTLGQLWAEKAHRVNFGRDETMAMRRGRILEPAVAAAMREARPNWTIEKATEYLVDPALRLGCTPDFYIRDERGRRGVLQAKTCTKMVFDKHWGEAPPPWIALQNATEIMLDDADFGCVATLIVDGYYFDCVPFEVPRHEGAEQRIREMVAKFWRDIADGVQPKIDFARDAALIAGLYPTEVEGKVIDLRGDNRLPELLAGRDRLAAAFAEIKQMREVVDTEIKAKMEDAESALVRGWRLTFKAQTRKAHQVKESTFRVLRSKVEEQAA